MQWNFNVFVNCKRYANLARKRAHGYSQAGPTLRQFTRFIDVYVLFSRMEFVLANSQHVMSKRKYELTGVVKRALTGESTDNVRYDVTVVTGLTVEPP